MTRDLYQASKLVPPAAMLLGAGISVFTTLNVQHLESLNDVVAQITGVRVAETVPDWVADSASEIELVDLPPPELVHRLPTTGVRGATYKVMGRLPFYRHLVRHLRYEFAGKPAA